MAVGHAYHNFPWLDVAQEIAEKQGFFHWELDFAPVFAHGGFGLQVGNPPWVRPDWDEAGVLAEFDPWWQLADKPAEAVKRATRNEALAQPDLHTAYLDERAEQAGVKENLGSGIDRPVLSGLQPDLYRCFMERTWRSMSATGTVALIHPESHFTELRASGLRRETYRRLRRHWQFRNELKLFSEINHTRLWGVHVYGRDSSVDFLQGSNLYHPDTVDRSFTHDGSGSSPGIKDAEGHWDLRPHSERIIAIREEQLTTWAALIDEPGTLAPEARMVYPVNRASAAVLDKIANAPRFGDMKFDWTRGWEEDRDRKLGFFESRSEIPTRWTDVILQGPHVSVATPLFKQPNPTMRNNLDWSDLSVDEICSDFVPRTNYQVSKPFDEYIAAYPKWHGESSSSFFRLAWRRMADAATVRSMHPAILPPGPTHVHLMLSATLESHRDLAIAAGHWASLPLDYFAKVAGVADLTKSVVSRLPHTRNHPLESQLILRTLRLNCLVRPHAPLWEALYDDAWRQDSWVPNIGVDHSARIGLGDAQPQWEQFTPLRRAADRRQALVEIDAIVAIMLGISAEELLTIYRTQFPVLQKYEREALYDATGRQLPPRLASEYRKKGSLTPAEHTVDGITYQEPFTGVDRENDMQLAYQHFAAAVGADDDAR